MQARSYAIDFIVQVRRHLRFHRISATHGRLLRSTFAPLREGALPILADAEARVREYAHRGCRNRRYFFSFAASDVRNDSKMIKRNAARKQFIYGKLQDEQII